MLIDLEAACRRMCGECAAGAPVALTTDGYWVHGNSVRFSIVCSAGELRHLAAEQGIMTDPPTPD